MTLKELTILFKENQEEFDKLKEVYQDHVEEFHKSIGTILNKDDIFEKMLNYKKTTDNEPEDVLYVVKLLDFDIEEENKEVKYSYYETWDSAIFKTNNQDDYPRSWSTMSYTYDQLMEMPIYERSIEEYGIYLVYLNCLYDLTWFGFTQEIHDKNRLEFEQELEEIGTSQDSDNYMTLDEFREELGFDKPSEKYYEQLRECANYCLQENEKIFKKLSLFQEKNI